MSRTLQFRRAGTAEMDSRILVEGEVQYDQDAKNLRVGDGVTPGGIPILNQGQLVAYGSLRYEAVLNHAPTVFVAADVSRRLGILNGPGDYTLPDIATVSIGIPILFYVNVAGCNLLAPAAQFLRDKANVTGSLALNQYETIEISRLNNTHYTVLNRY